MSTYLILKKTLKRLLPHSFLMQIESPLRWLFSLKYRGSCFQCNICEVRLASFIPIENDLLCPRCGSLQRNRKLYNLLVNEYLVKGISILDFSPSRSLYRKLKRYPANYVASDFAGEFRADVTYDITQIPLEDEQFDLIICYHILEHIQDDQKSMSELFRVTKAGGVCIIQTPFKEGDIFEDSSIQSPEERAKHFGQHDHVRVYSQQGLADRLRKAGFIVSVLGFLEPHNNLHGFQQSESILIARKSLPADTTPKAS